MKSEDELAELMLKVPLMTAAGPWSRVVAYRHTLAAPPGSDRPEPLWGGGAVLHGARFTPPGSFPTLYLSSDVVTALQEVDAVFRPHRDPLLHFRNPPWVVISVDGAVSGVLDLTNDEVLEALDLDIQTVTGDWRLQQRRHLDAASSLSPTQRLGRVAFGSGRVKGIKSRSARDVEQGVSYAIFLERLGGESYVEVYDPDRHLSDRHPK